MHRRAPRPALHLLQGLARGARRMAYLLLAGVAVGAPAAADTITAAQFSDPTDRYAHGILGDAIEWGGLTLTLSDGTMRRFKLPRDHVFEDTAPRLVDLDGDGAPEVMVVETDMRLGGALAIYGAGGKITETPHIGRTNRWLAPIGAADLDGDGLVELAYIDRPHLAKTLRIWRYENQMLREVASLPGLTNHRIGEADIAGGIRTCAGRPEMIVATADWSQLLAVAWGANGFATTVLGRDTRRTAFGAAMTCAAR